MRDVFPRECKYPDNVRQYRLVFSSLFRSSNRFTIADCFCHGRLENISLTFVAGELRLYRHGSRTMLEMLCYRKVNSFACSKTPSSPATC